MAFNGAGPLAIFLTLLSIAVLAIGGLVAYQQGYLDPIIEQIGIYFFKAKAKAEEKKLQAEGMEAGKDFVGSELKGNQQAEEVKEGLGAFGDLKKRK